MSKRTAIIISVSSDIGLYIAKRFLKEGFEVIGTYRHHGRIDELEQKKRVKLVKCDVSDDSDIGKFIEYCRKRKVSWDIFISCVGDLHPLTGFFQSKFEEWEKSVEINAISQLKILHDLYPLRSKKKTVAAVFFAGGGVNNAVLNISAYTISKIMLIKMCEFLDAECPDLNIFAVGPGWTRTKIHGQETLDLLKHKKGTSLSDIYACIMWLVKMGKKIVGGRNFSVVHDPWKGRLGPQLVQDLKKDPNKYKLRRYKNDKK